MGRVFKAEDVQLQRTVAIKFLSPELLGGSDHRARFLREARMASALNHPHICVIHEIGEDAGAPFIAMEHVQGRSLQEIVQAGSLSLDDAIRYGKQIAEALRHAHDRDILHRDLKTANVMVTAEGSAKVLDFGLAKRLTEDVSGPTLRPSAAITEAGTFLGTMAYAAPEVLRGAAADARSDVWSLGVILFETASGKLPFDGPTAFAVTTAIQRDAPAPFSERVPSALRTIILKCLDKDPDRRYQRAGELAKDLSVLDSVPGRAVPVPKARERASRFKIGAIALAAGVIILAGIWGFSKRSAPKAPTKTNGAALSTGGRASPVPEANEYFERAMQFVGPQFDLAKGGAMLERALELDPAFAEARAWRGFTYIAEIDSGFSIDSGLLFKADEQLKKALQDDPKNARAHSALAALYFFQSRKDLMLPELEKALRLNPEDLDSYNWMALYRVLNGELDAAEELWRRIIEKDPLFFPARMNVAYILRMKGDPAGAIRELAKILELDPRNPYALGKTVAALIDLNDLAEARLRLDAIPAANRKNYDVELLTGIVLALEGKTAAARKAVSEDALKFAAISPLSALSAAQLFAVLGEPETALDWLERAVRNGDERIEWFQRDRLLAPIRDLPRFKQIIDSVAFRRAQRAPGGDIKR